MYQPTAIPDDSPPGLKSYLADQLRQIAIELQRALSVPVLGAEPARYFDGMIVYADGSSWDPGSGEGFYGRENGAWVKL